MNTSIYQFMCTGGPHGGESTEMIENKFFMLGSLYASTRDFSAFEIGRYSTLTAFGIGVEIDTEFEVGKIYQFGEKDDKKIGMAIIWHMNSYAYVGIQYLGEYPLIVEIPQNDKWFKVYFNDEHTYVAEFVASFKDKYDIKMQSSIKLAISRLNISITLDHVDIPGLCPIIY